MCPTVRIDSINKHVYAGCGPLVMSQVLRYYQQPVKNTVSGMRYQWNYMPDRISDTASIDKQNAVAQLIRDCGVAAETNYRLSASSTKLNSVITGLKSHFGYNKYMHIVDRAYFQGSDGSKAWNTIIFNELKSGRPVILRGEKGSNNAHVFIIDGCKDSMVHVNWGWNGWRNGYYNPDTLYGYSKWQRMIVGITPKTVIPVLKHVHLNTPGRLASHITADDWLYMHHIKITGAINNDDIRLLRMLAGGAGKGPDVRNGNLSSIDLSESVILTLPDSAFAGCDNLTYISLPITLPEISDYAFSGCSKLNEIRIYPLVHIIGQRAFSGCFNLIDIRLPASLRVIGTNAFNSCNSLTSVTLPAGVTTIGSGAFAHARNLRQLIIHKQTGTINTSVIKGTKVKQIKRI